MATDHLLSEAAALRAAGRVDAAMALVRQAIGGAPDCAPALLLLGQFLQQQGHHAEAAEQFARALALEPRLAGAASAYGVALSNLGRIDEAIASFRQAVALDAGERQAQSNLGVLLLFQERPAEAVPYFQQALALAPDDPEMLNGLGVALLKLRRVDEAVAALRGAVARAGGAAEPHNNLGLALLRLGQVTEAIASFRRAAALEPDYVDALLNLAQALHRSNDLSGAADAYRALLRAEPDYAAGHFALGTVVAAMQRWGEAIVCFERSLTLCPEQPEALLHLAESLQAFGRLDAALERCAQAMTLRPGLAAAHIGRANVLRAQGRLEEAIEGYRRAVEIAPADAVARANLGSALAEHGESDAAIEAYQGALGLDEDLVEAHHGLARVLRRVGRYPATVALLDRVLALRPDLAEAHADKGNLLKEMGQLAAARDALETAIALAPDNAEFYHSLAECVRFTPGDPRLAAMEALAARAETLPEEGQTALPFALGKAYADIGDTERSFAAFSAGNARKRKQVDYDEAATLGVLEHVRKVFTAELMRTRRGTGFASRVPVFIVGMPRSGSTLVEQILASHPDVHGAGEEPVFHDAVASLAEAGDAPTAYPGCVPGLTAGALELLGERYVARQRQGAAGAGRITDKMLGNFRFVGLIHMALPHAQVIHTRRDPVDTCLSCFSKLFAGNLPYTYELGELGRYYRAYERVMAHWHAVLPPDVILDVDYEAVVADLEGAARRIVAHCGLTWDSRCLEFHTSDRPVRTASVVQVRQPIYGAAVGRARPYVRQLRPLLDALNGA